MLSPDLVGFVKEGLGRGLSRGELESILLSAVFELATTAERELRRQPFSRHDAGRHCFQLRADPDRSR